MGVGYISEYETGQRLYGRENFLTTLRRAAYNARDGSTIDQPTIGAFCRPLADHDTSGIEAELRKTVGHLVSTEQATSLVVERDTGRVGAFSHALVLVGLLLSQGDRMSPSDLRPLDGLEDDREALHLA